MRIIRAADRKVMPWKNGGGTTTEIAVFPEGASLGDFDWRISTAQVGRDGPFSCFPGIDRTLSILSGDGIRLAFRDGETVMLDRGAAPFAFAADRAVTGLLVHGTIDDLNVMSRRGRWSHEMRRLTDDAPHRLEANAGLLVLVVGEGLWRLQGEAGEARLAVGDGVILPAPASAVLTGAGEIFAIRLRPAG